MYQLNERVSALFNKTKNCTLSTNGEYPNTIVIMFKEINAQGEILLCDVFMNKTLANLEKDAHVSVVVYEGLEGYQIKGTARWTDDADLVGARQRQDFPVRPQDQGCCDRHPRIR